MTEGSEGRPGRDKLTGGENKEILAILMNKKTSVAASTYSSAHGDGKEAGRNNRAARGRRLPDWALFDIADVRRPYMRSGC